MYMLRGSHVEPSKGRVWGIWWILHYKIKWLSLMFSILWLVKYLTTDGFCFFAFFIFGFINILANNKEVFYICGFKQIFISRLCEVHYSFREILKSIQTTALQLFKGSKSKCRSESQQRIAKIYILTLMNAREVKSMFYDSDLVFQYPDGNIWSDSYFKHSRIIK